VIERPFPFPFWLRFFKVVPTISVSLHSQFMRRFTMDMYIKREISSLLKDIDLLSENRPPALESRETATYQHDGRSSCDGLDDDLVHHGSSLVEAEKIEMRILPLVDKLTEHHEPPREFLIFAIYGPGGVGKTTVARKIFDDQRTQSAFSARAWVSISRASTVAQILQATCAAIGVLQGPKTKADALQTQLADRIEGRRVFLVFNVHNGGGPSSHHHQGGSTGAEIFGNLVEVLKLFRAAQGSRALVTTTDENVGNEIRSAQIQKGAAEGFGLQTDRLWQLPVEDGWALLLRAAGLEPAKVTPELKKVGVAIVQRCNCLPLAIEAVGGLLRRKGYAQEEWKRVRDSEAFELKDPATGTQGGTGSSVYLSYQHAPPRLKQCFHYLSLFPADVEIERRRVTQLWISEGLVDPGSSEEGSSTSSRSRRHHNNNTQETAGEQQSGASQEGSSRSSRHNNNNNNTQSGASTEIAAAAAADDDDREDSTSSSQGPPRELPRLSSSRHHSPRTSLPDTMPSHRSDQEEVADCYLTELAGTGLLQWTNRRGQYKMHDQVRKIAESLTENEVCAGDPRYAATTTLPENLIRLSFLNKGLAALPENVARMTGLRTLLLSGNPLGETDVDTVCKNLGGSLRVLDLSETEIRSVPKSLGNLARLRHLDLSRTKIAAVHESVGRLRRLRFLGLRGCGVLTSLPRSIHKLAKLEYLDFRDGGVANSTRSLHSLRHLTLLHGFVVDSVSSSNAVLLEDLKHMSRLSDLQIDITKTVAGKNAGDKMLKEKGSLRNLELRWCPVTSAVDPKTLETMLTQLHPHQCLVSLKIDGYHGPAYPEWLCSSDLPNLQRLSLENCWSWERLPPIWHLQKLRSLRMANLPKLQRIDMPQPPAEAAAFPNVEEMEVEGMEVLECWSDFQPGDLLQLRKLALRRCPKLCSLPGLEHCKVISTMELKDAELVHELANIPVQELVVEAMPRLTRVSNLPLMKVFTVVGCPQLERLSGVDSLQHVHVRDDEHQLQRLPAWLGGQQHFPRIETLDVEGGEELLARCERGNEDWHIVREIPRVYGYRSPGRLPYFSYARGSDFFCRHKAPQGADAPRKGRPLRSPESAASSSSPSRPGGGNDAAAAEAAAPADEARRRFWSRGPRPVDETYKKFLSVMSLFVVIVLWMITSLTDSHRNLLEDIALFFFYVCTVCYFIFLVTKRRNV
jgi:Leucine-rich repeat (LRR) protein